MSSPPKGAVSPHLGWNSAGKAVEIEVKFREVSQAPQGAWDMTLFRKTSGMKSAYARGKSSMADMQ